MPLFQEMELPSAIQNALKKMNFSQPTPIQEMTIPIARSGLDLIGCAQTGTGKTAAFCIPIVSKIIEHPSTTALVLVPTRELALQISEVLKSLTSDLRNIRTVLVIGGVEMHKQTRELRQRPSIIVATPGRLNDHIRRQSAHLGGVETVVLDEGDRMLDMGFEKQITEILKFVGKRKQMMLFSATMPEKIKQLAKKYMREPQYFSAGKLAKPVEKMSHSIVRATKGNKKDILLDELNARQGSVLIFVNTKHGTNRLNTYLEEYGYKVARIHGGRSQGQRNQALKGFREGKFRILVATDVAARGLDVPHIAHVINFDLPKDIDDYVHRIGRTARAGAPGEALCLLSTEDRNHWNQIAKRNNLETFPGAPEEPLQQKKSKPNFHGPRDTSKSSRHRPKNQNKRHFGQGKRRDGSPYAQQ